MSTTDQSTSVDAADPTPGDGGDEPRTPRWRASLLGLAAAVAGLGAGELLAGLLGVVSPVVAVGDLVVVNVPEPVKQLAIELFGTADKIALIVGIVVLLTLAALGIGRVTAWRRGLGLALTGVFGLIGVAAVLLTASSTWLALLPAVTAGVVAVAVLWWTTRSGPSEPSVARQSTIDRRALLRGGAAAAAGVAGLGVGRAAASRRADAVESARASADVPPPTEPVAFASDLQLDVEGISAYETPNSDFYRIDTALEVPRLSREGWELTITGMVAEPLTLTLDDLEQRYEVVERAITMTCVSNEVGGGLVGNARWRGVLLADVLEDVGVDGGANQIVGRAFDDFTTGFPVEAAFDRDAMLVVGMNDEPLPAEHGFPLRLVVPGLYGYVSATKWLREIELTTFDSFDQYWVERGWAERAPIKTQSRIDTPAGFARLSGEVAVAGVAWAQTRGIERVQVRVDEGDWVDAELAAAFDDVTWRQWVWRWDTSQVERGRHDLEVRAIDGAGDIQTAERTPPFPDGAAGWHRVVVTVVDADG